MQHADLRLAPKRLCLAPCNPMQCLQCPVQIQGGAWCTDEALRSAEVMNFEVEPGDVIILGELRLLLVVIWTLRLDVVGACVQALMLGTAQAHGAAGDLTIDTVRFMPQHHCHGPLAGKPLAWKWGAGPRTSSA